MTNRARAKHDSWSHRNHANRVELASRPSAEGDLKGEKRVVPDEWALAGSMYSLHNISWLDFLLAPKTKYHTTDRSPGDLSSMVLGEVC